MPIYDTLKTNGSLSRFQPCRYQPSKFHECGELIPVDQFIKFKKQTRCEISNRNKLLEYPKNSRQKFNGQGRRFAYKSKIFYAAKLSKSTTNLTTLKVFYPRLHQASLKNVRAFKVKEWPVSNSLLRIQHPGWAGISQFIQWESARQWLYFRHYITSNPQKLYRRGHDYLSNRESNSLGGTGAQAMYDDLVTLSQIESSVSEYRPNAAQLLERQVRIALVEGWKNPLLNVHESRMKRLKLLRCFRRSPNAPVWMLLTVLPVLPPDLRPIVKLDHEQVAIADLNKLYQKVIVRSRRLERLLFNRYFKHSDECAYSQRLLQEAVDALIENGKGGATPMCTVTRRPLKSLSDMLKGKKGRFRQNLLGKRVDYSGRSVIVVAPSLRVHDCGLPREMAVELFQPFLVRRLLLKRLCRTVLGARRLIQKRSSVVWAVLHEVLNAHPVFLNRAPTLHRLSIQAFCPQLIGGRAILLHPLVCSAFNADFDGDQMAVHIPLAFEARAEAWKLAWSCNNILSLASGDAILAPSQDMVIGCYFLTTSGKESAQTSDSYLTEIESLKVGASRGLEVEVMGLKNYPAHPQQPIWMPWSHGVEFEGSRQPLLEIRCTQQHTIKKLYPFNHRDFKSYRHHYNQRILTTLGRVLFHELITKQD